MILMLFSMAMFFAMIFATLNAIRSEARSGTMLGNRSILGK